MEDKLDKALDVLGVLFLCFGTLIMGLLTIELAILLWNTSSTLMVLAGVGILIAGLLLTAIGALFCYSEIKSKLK